MNQDKQTGEEQIFESLLEYLRRSRGFDFTGYKRSSLQRRMRRRMQFRQIDTFGDYLDYLEVHPDEFEPLFNTILINVTSFFRDSDAWDYFQSQTLPSLLERKGETDPIRIWVAGCASGEEAYTVAIVFCEALGVEAFRRRVKIYATDVDEEALVQARQATYEAKSLANVPETWCDRYFDKSSNHHTFRSDLRRSIIFGRHDLVQDAPISKLDLLTCRNTLMYFNSETQSRILARLHFALDDTGVLFLGKAEMLLTHSNLFSPLSLQHRIFMKVPRVDLRDRLLLLAQSGEESAGDRLASNVHLREAAFNAAPVAQLITDFNGLLVMANDQSRALFGINLQDLGRPFRDLEISYRPLELRSLIDQVYSDKQTLIVNDVERQRPDQPTQFLDVHLSPLQENGSDLLGVSIAFVDVTHYHRLQGELYRTNQELETANEELQSSNEELETTNEELQSTNEELETTNEELQSTNEELETMNEELQSTNEELQTMNDELRLRTTDLNRANAFLSSILASLNTGVVVVDRQFTVISWNTEAENLWGLRADEVQGHSFLALDIGLEVDRLREPIRECLRGNDRIEQLLSATNRRGRAIQCRISLTPLTGSLGDRQGVILMMEEIDATEAT
ncbi:MAG: CheR family methyltransferase [Synechococcales bacterium]|nr:CheR family methyltransferase [Synechococcales bacterium]